MPSPNATPTPITPPRVPLIDPRTGLIDRAWYLFFLSLLNAATIVDDGDLGVDTVSLIASYDAALQALAQNVDTQPPPVDLSAELTKQIQEAGLTDQSSALLSQVAEMQKQIEALNLLPPPSQGTVTAVTATAPVVSSGGTEPNISMPAASTSTDGYLTSTDWNTFNNKAPATSGTSILYGNGSGGFSNVTIGTGVSFVAGTLSATGSGGSVTTVSVVSANGFAGTVANPTTTPAITLTTSISGMLYGNGTALAAATISAPLAYSAGTLSITQSGASTNGYLSSTDWNTFNNKQSTSAPVTYTANFSVAVTDNWIINNKSGSSCTATLPAAASYSGRVLHFQNYQAQTLVSASSNVVPLAGGAAGTSILLASSGDSATLVSDGTNWLMTQYIPNNILLLE
jgi:hypothetical protein